MTIDHLDFVQQASLPFHHLELIHRPSLLIYHLDIVYRPSLLFYHLDIVHRAPLLVDSTHYFVRGSDLQARSIADLTECHPKFICRARRPGHRVGDSSIGPGCSGHRVGDSSIGSGRPGHCVGDGPIGAAMAYARLTDPLSCGSLNYWKIGNAFDTMTDYLWILRSLMANAKPYALMIDTRFDSSAEAMIGDLMSGQIDAGILWGPMAGFYAKRANPPLHVTPLVKETTGPRLTFRIGMGVRGADQNWKRLLNRLIQENQPAINRILLDFGVPLLDENDRPIGAETATKLP
jgi:hypothetical protein